MLSKVDVLIVILSKQLNKTFFLIRRREPRCKRSVGVLEWCLNFWKELESKITFVELIYLYSNSIPG